MKWLFSSVFGIIGVIFLLIGCPFMAVGAGMYYYGTASTADWVLVPGEVTGLRTSESTDSDGFSSTTYCPTVAYTTAEGEAFEVNVAECSSPPAYETGDAVEVYYDPANPESVRLKGGVAQTLGTVFTIVFGGIGALLVVVGLALGVVGVVVALRRNTA